ncbi:MAG: hydantoinase/oxoprolinase family protein [Lacrimispora sp.]
MGRKRSHHTFGGHGVAAGIIEVLNRIMDRYGVKPDDVSFIAHGTTQATNALLEGDVAKVGIITVGTGIEGVKSRSDTQMGTIKLTETKFLPTTNSYVDSKAPDFAEKIAAVITELMEDGAESIVAAEAFSVDKPENEKSRRAVQEERHTGHSYSRNFQALRPAGKTRTAVVNASIMPKMLEAANMTAESIKKTGIEAKLMVMRCDGGVMTVDEVQKHPILTILSGPAAGVAGALMYEKLTDGLFLEVGGTSTDISCVKDGKVMVSYSQIGGHKTFLTSLDVRTVGIGGGSMIQISGGKITDTGPRSAHIAGLEYEVYTDEKSIVNPVLKSMKLNETDGEYAYIECENGERYALTLSGAANIAGFVPERDYAKGNAEAAKKAWAPLAKNMNISVEKAARLALEYAAKKNSRVVAGLIEDYHLDPRTVVMVGGGGGASAVVPHLAEYMKLKFKIANNAPVISTIGVALALVRDVVERTIVNPTEQDILKVRKEAREHAILSGAAPDSVSVSVEVETQKNLVRAIAIGNTEIRSKDLGKGKIDEAGAKKIVSENLQVPVSKLFVKAQNGQMYVMIHELTEKKFFGLLKHKTYPLRLIDDEGVIRLQKKNGDVKTMSGDRWEQKLKKVITENATYGDGGEELPSVYVISGKSIINLSGMASIDHMISVAKAELAVVDKDDKLICICTERTE